MHRVLVANRGEIAVRIMRTCSELGIETVAVHSSCDRAALHVRMADAAYPIGGETAADSYLQIDRIVDVARRSGADAVHPGYGFLAENAVFADVCRDAGLIFIGPPPEAIRLMGSKTAARAVARRAGVPIVAGSGDPLPEDASDTELDRRAAAVGYPLLVKAVAGGGGKGMRRVGDPRQLVEAVRTARSEAASSFGDASVYFERQLVEPRHVEVQLLADAHGHVVPFVERECSIQRRHQKLLEETPSVVVSEDVRTALLSAAARIAAEAGYTNAGTVEFLFDEAHESFYFLEMNTRLQVEHPITELVTGVDLVRAQLALARGARLADLGPAFDPDSLATARGHAIECRVYAEDPAVGFMPSPGRLTHVQPPGGPGVRDDTGVVTGSEIPVFYDSLISKVSTWGTSREMALARMTRAMDEYDIRGVATTVPFFRRLLRDPDFRAARVQTTFVDDWLATQTWRRGLDASDTVLATVAAVLEGLPRAGEAPAGLGRSSAGAGPGRTPSAADGWRAHARAEAVRHWP